MEYALKVCDPTGAQKINKLMDRLNRTTSHVKMSSRLLKAKKIILSLQFNAQDEWL